MQNDKDETKVLESETDDLTTIDLDIHAGRKAGFAVVDSKQAKMARIKAEIAAGEYKPDSEEVAKVVVKKLKI